MAIDYKNQNVLVMGLGLNGGGLESAKFLLARGARVKVTDTKDEAALLPSVEALTRFANERGLPAPHFVLGRHETADFAEADFVVKNPVVHPDSPFLLASRRVESDMSLFLRENPARLTAVTGTKGKSTAASAIYAALSAWHKKIGGRAYLGGNITVSPLSFLDDLTSADDVVLELSSWQLGDLRGKTQPNGRPLLKPRAALITAIMSDHQNWYHSMDAYTADKRVIYAGQDERDALITLDDDWGKSFLSETRAKKIALCGGLIPQELQSLTPRIPVEHARQNLLLAGLALVELGLPPAFVKEALESFGGVEHRLELFLERDGIRFYNDSAATIPEAAASAITALAGSNCILITGGTDKELDFTPLARAARLARRVILLAGSGTDKLIPLLQKENVLSEGPFDSLDGAVNAALKSAAPPCSVLFSPGCTSFGMFANEFDRGRQFKAMVIACR